MRGTLYAATEILAFLVVAAAIGFALGWAFTQSRRPAVAEAAAAPAPSPPPQRDDSSLLAAHEACQGTVSERLHGALLHSRARIAWELGERMEALAVLGQILDLGGEESPRVTAGPVLSTKTIYALMDDLLQAHREIVPAWCL